MTGCRELAAELAGDDIRVDVVDPGVIKPAMVTQDPSVVRTLDEAFPLHRDGQPEDVAGSARFLASDDAVSVPGHDLVMGGGSTTK